MFELIEYIVHVQEENKYIFKLSFYQGKRTDLETEDVYGETKTNPRYRIKQNILNLPVRWLKAANTDDQNESKRWSELEWAGDFPTMSQSETLSEIKPFKDSFPLCGEAVSKDNSM